MVSVENEYEDFTGVTPLIGDWGEGLSLIAPLPSLSIIILPLFTPLKGGLLIV